MRIDVESIRQQKKFLTGALIFLALWIGATGNVALTTLGGNDVTFTAVPGGTVLPVGCTHVLATGTTATGIVALIEQ